MSQDFFVNGAPQGDIADRLMACNCDPNVLRPYKETPDGPSYVTMNGQAVIDNANATLLKDEWIQLDRAVIMAAKKRLRAVADLEAAGLTYSVGGMGFTVLQTQSMSDITPAQVTMDGLEEGPADRPQNTIVNLPLPITHKDFTFTMREIMASRNGTAPLDTTTASLAGEKVAEEIEKMLIGSRVGLSYGDGSIAGYTTFSDTLDKTITSPASSGWAASTTVTELLQMRNQAYDAFHYGPYMLYYSPNWSIYMDDEYKTESSLTLAQRLAAIDGINGVRRLDYLTNYDLILVQMSPNVVRMVNGMDITTVQWDSHGGFQKHFKVLAIKVPQIRSDYNGNTGIVYGTV